MAITVRKGYENQFDSNKMLPGEFAVTTDTHKVYVCMAAGISKELASVEELQSILGASDEAFQAFQELINAMESGTVITGLLTDVNNLKSGEYTISFAEAEERTNIEVTDTVKTILGKIKKFFTDLSTVAFSGKYEDLTGTPTLANVATSGSYADLKNLPTLGDAASKAVANNDTTTEAGYVADARAVNALGKEVDELNTKIKKIYGHSIVATFSDGIATIDLKDVSGNSYKPYAMILTPQSINAAMRYNWDASTAGALAIIAVDLNGTAVNGVVRFAYIAFASPIN